MGKRQVPGADAIEKRMRGERERALWSMREIAEVLEVPRELHDALRTRLESMLDERRLTLVRGVLYGLPERLGDMRGRYRRKAAGFGFVKADEPTEVDVMIPEGAERDALSGDLVAVVVDEVKPDGRRSGRVLRVVERRSARTLGTFYRARDGGGHVEPLDPEAGYTVRIARGATLGAETGEVVGVDLDTLPRGDAPARGQVAERLGRRELPGVDIEILIRKYGLSPGFPADAEREAGRLPADPAKWDMEGREDFTAQPIVTIDGEDAKDFDDAILVERREGGGYRLHVFIADVAYFVREGGALDRAATERGTSVYFPGRVVPMLPERLSNDLCSLRPDEPRLTQGVTIEMDGKGATTGVRFHDGLIRSHARLTYGEVNDLLAGDRDVRKRRAALVPVLEDAATLADLLDGRRRKRGAVDMEMEETHVVLDAEGRVTDLVRRERGRAERMIESFMVAANEAVARALVDGEQPALHRVHEPPEAVRVVALRETLAGLGYGLEGPSHKVKPGDFSRLLAMVRGRPEELFITRQVLRTMALARYDPQPLGHFGLALLRYAHFTSPIRRYPDLVVHRALRRLRRVGPTDTMPLDDRRTLIAVQGRESSRLERDAEAAERESMRWKTSAFMAQRLGESFEGRVVDVSKQGAMVLLDAPYVEGLVPIDRLGEERFRFDAPRRRLVGLESGRVVRLGQRVEVLVDRVDQVRHFIDFALAGEKIEAPERKRRKRGPTRRRRR